jgi:hypothetical protein
VRQVGRFEREADINWLTGSAGLVENDPQQTSDANVRHTLHIPGLAAIRSIANAVFPSWQTHQTMAALSGATTDGRFGKVWSENDKI